MLYIPLWNGYFKIRGAKEDPIPYMTKLELALFLLNIGYWPWCNQIL